jgi:diguanylate cyclase (GGDEF)-like protein
MLLDLDRFKEINDTLGHHYGDRLLAQSGPRLDAAVREADTVARLGGDEFAVFLRSLPAGSETALQAAERLRGALSEPFELDGFMVEVESSIGIALYPDDGDNVDTLLQRADVAMYKAKQTGDGQLLYSRDFDHYSPARLALVGDLRLAIDDGGLEVWFQPKLNLRGGNISGFEALVRWRHPTLGLLQPSAFIELAEHTGLIRPLTQRVLDMALGHRGEWLTEGVDLPIAVNVSARSFHDRQFANAVAILMETHSAAPQALRLELTESSIMAEPERAAATMARLRELGIQFAVDDFGTGHSSLALLRHLPVTEIKLDKGFVLRMSTSPGDAAIVRSTIDLGRSLGLRVVAEGIEDAETLRILRELGCDEAQGFWVGAPIPASEVVAWLRRRDYTHAPHSVTAAAVTPLKPTARGRGRPKRPAEGESGMER